MDKNRSGMEGFFGQYTPADPSMNVSVSAGPAGSIVSPYLNFDPNYITSGDSQYILPEGASRQRGRLETSFSHIGGAVILGAIYGGGHGLITGYRETKALQLAGSVRQTQVLNFITKQGASYAQSLGVIALMYSVVGVMLQLGRGVDDELNTLTAGTAAGMLYKSSAGWKRCLAAGGVGFGIAAAYSLFINRDRIRSMLSN